MRSTELISNVTLVNLCGFYTVRERLFVILFVIGMKSGDASGARLLCLCIRISNLVDADKKTAKPLVHYSTYRVLYVIGNWGRGPLCNSCFPIHSVRNLSLTGAGKQIDRQEDEEHMHLR